MKTHGRRVLGSFSGLLFGLSLTLLLLVFGVVSLDSVVVLLVPMVGLVFGFVLATLAPLGHRPTPNS